MKLASYRLQGYIPGLALAEHSFDAILSKDLLHHLPNPMVLWREAQRLGRLGAAVYVMDLIRPATQQAARDIVEAVAPREHPILKEDFYNSLCAAFTMEEAEAQLRQARMLLEVAQVSESSHADQRGIALRTFFAALDRPTR